MLGIMGLGDVPNGLKPGLLELLKVLSFIKTLGIQCFFDLVDDVEILHVFDRGPFVIHLEGTLDVFRVIYEVDDKSRIFARRRPVDFGPCVTWGAFRCQVEEDRLEVIPLPGSDDFSVTLRLDRIPSSPSRKVVSVVAVDSGGAQLRTVPHHRTGAECTFTTRRGEFAYHVRLD